MSRLTDKISYLQGLAEGMKLNPEKETHRLILGILDVLGEAGDSFEALAEAHSELSDYVESIDEDLADLEADLYDEDEEDAEDEEEAEENSVIEYECPHCGKLIEIDPDDVDFGEDARCPACGKELFPELPENAEAGKAPSEKEAGEPSGKEEGKAPSGKDED